MPAIVAIAMTLKPAQFTSIEERYAQSNAEYRDDFMQADPKRARAMVSARQAGAEWLYGDLDRSQRERPAQSVADSPFDPQLAYDERRRRQQDALQTLYGGSPTAACTTGGDNRDPRFAAAARPFPARGLSGARRAARAAHLPDGRRSAQQHVDGAAPMACRSAQLGLRPARSPSKSAAESTRAGRDRQLDAGLISTR
jgi:hypothetical protein